eukprot:2177695-Heterocapsa_arctica.AAC.1
MRLSKLGAMRVFRSEALGIIKERQDHRDIAIVVEVTSNTEEERVHFKFYRNCGIRHYASYLYSTKCMRTITGNNYTTSQGTCSERTIDIEATIVESILRLGAIFAEHGIQVARISSRHGQRVVTNIEEPQQRKHNAIPKRHCRGRMGRVRRVLGIRRCADRIRELRGACISTYGQ